MAKANYYVISRCEYSVVPKRIGSNGLPVTEHRWVRLTEKITKRDAIEWIQWHSSVGLTGELAIEKDRY